MSFQIPPPPSSRAATSRKPSFASSTQPRRPPEAQPRIASQRAVPKPVSQAKWIGKIPFCFHHSTCRAAMRKPDSLSTSPPWAYSMTGTGPGWCAATNSGRSFAKMRAMSAAEVR